jgi:hypothetical protein
MPSPILRPIGRRREDEEREIEIEGAGETVNGLTLGPAGSLVGIEPRERPQGILIASDKIPVASLQAAGLLPSAESSKEQNLP